MEQIVTLVPRMCPLPHTQAALGGGVWDRLDGDAEIQCLAGLSELHVRSIRDAFTQRASECDRA